MQFLRLCRTALQSLVLFSLVCFLVLNAHSAPTLVPQAVPVPTAPLDPAKQKMVFQGETENYAWVAHHEGWYIDASGALYTYRYDGRRTDAFKQAPICVGHIPPKVLAQKRALIPQAAHGTFTRRQARADAGAKSFTAYLKDPKTGAYTPVPLFLWGDFDGSNSAPEAKKLVTWLEAVQPDGKMPSLPAPMR